MSLMLLLGCMTATDCAVPGYRYRNHVEAGGFSVTAMKRITDKLKIDDAQAMKQLMLEQQAELKKSDAVEGSDARELLEQNHARQQLLVAAQRSWGWKCCICKLCDLC